MIAQESLLRAEGVAKHFPMVQGVIFRSQKGSVRAVDGVSFTLETGETFGVVGESGCGKTTLAKLLLRIENPTEGRVLFRENDVSSLDRDMLASYRREIQVVFQDPYSSLNPRMPVTRIIGEPLAIHYNLTRQQIQDRVRELLRLVGLPEGSGFLFPHQFSGGQRQRIAVARALASNPTVMILDEPVSALDVSIRAQIMNLLKDLQREFNLAYVMIAHDLAAVRYMSTKVGVMYLGQMVESGPIETVYSNPLHPYTQALLASALPVDPRRRDQQNVIVGEIPSALNPPSGCRFHTRCPFAMEHCSTIQPETQEVEDRSVACHLYN